MPLETLGERYELEREVGAGAMGVVYLARDTRTGERVAVKVLRAGRPRNGAERFAREVRLLRGLSHARIVHYLDEGWTAPGDPYLVMEWIEGETLASYLDRCSLSLGGALPLVAALADALAGAHAAGIVHRDVKPSNIVIVGGTPRDIKLIDFGIARGPADDWLTEAGAVVGTPGYISPEQARGASAIDGRADLFSLGCVLYRCVTGTAPFDGEHPLAVLAKLVLDEPTPISALRRDAPPRLVALVDALLSKSPEERPSSASAVRDELLAIAAELPAGASSRPAAIAAATPALTTGELRICAVVLAMPEQRAVDEAAPTVRLDADAAPLRTAVARFGASLDVLRNGALVVAVSGKGPATDRAARAARCAMLLRSMLPGAAFALATGPAVVTDDVPLGEVIDRAARLLATGGRIGAILVDDVARGLLDARFAIERRAGTNVLVGEPRTEPIRKLLGKAVACIGRERELATLHAVYDESIAKNVARAALVVGEAGIGKSRLCLEFVRQLESSDRPPIVLLGRGDPLTIGSPFALVAPALRRLAGIHDDEPLEVRRRKLEQLVNVVEAPRRDHVLQFLGELTGIPAASESLALRSARADPALMRDLLRGAWESWVEAACRIRPMLVVVEDLQWGDLPSTKLIAAALRSPCARPLMVLALARPSVDDLVAAAPIASHAAHRIKLSPLALPACTRLVRDALGPNAADADVARIAAGADGNAFHLEELVRAFAAGLGGTPQTVIAMLHARLDELMPEARRAIRAASVFGTVFWRGGLSALLGPDAARIDDALRELERNELILKQDASRFAGDAEYLFRHALVSEAAYAMLTEADRALGHRLAATWLEERADAEPQLIAEHFERSGDDAAAASWNRRAAEIALAGGDFDTVIARADNALRVARDVEQRGLMRRVQAEAHFWRAEYPLAERAATDAAALLPVGSEPWLQAITISVTAARTQGSGRGTRAAAEALIRLPIETAVAAAASFASAVTTCISSLQTRVDRSPEPATPPDLGERLLERIDEIEPLVGDNPLALGWIHSARSWRAQADGELGACHLHDRLAMHAFTRAGDVRNACLNQAHVGYDELMLGRYAEAESSLRAAIADAERMGLAFVIAQAKHNLGMALLYLGQTDDARAVELEALSALEQTKAKMLTTWAHAYLARIELAAGRPDDAWEHAAAAVEQSNGASQAAVVALAAAAEARLAQGRTADALSFVRRFEAVIERGYSVLEGEPYAQLVRAETLERAGLVDEARSCACAAGEWVLERAARIRDAASRGTFLDSVPEHARVLALARRWRDRRR